VQFFLDGFGNHFELFFVKVIFFLIGIGAAEYNFVLNGNVVMETNADDDDIYYDEVSSGLLIAEIRRSRQDDGFGNHFELFFVKVIFFLIGIGAAEYNFVLVHNFLSCY